MRAISLIACIGLLSGLASAGSVSWSDQGVVFDLEVVDAGGMLTGTLKVTSDASGEFLKYVGFKAMPAPDAYGSGAMTGQPGGYTFVDGFRGGTSGIEGAGSGFVGADHSGNGPLMDGTTYTFSFSWQTNTDPLQLWSIKAWTADGEGGKGRQWSSGELGPNGVPEPAALTLVAIGAIWWIRRRR